MSGWRKQEDEYDWDGGVRWVGEGFGDGFGEAFDQCARPRQIQEAASAHENASIAPTASGDAALAPTSLCLPPEVPDSKSAETPRFSDAIVEELDDGYKDGMIDFEEFSVIIIVDITSLIANCTLGIVKEDELQEKTDMNESNIENTK